ncbi:uncharacterized protein LOC131329585 [Rhododendron vialii]|uniref:uncharacterized protein LOC131329585 n=1 Tax=Rhododendron vialii TaxID=182163 RepID=UPI00265D97BB|nr:uncharacterized protein LOC131329585 [Rhododendron vialii]
MASHHLFLNTSSRSLRIKQHSACFLAAIRRYSLIEPKTESSGLETERTEPKKLEEYERLREEYERLKEAKARQGFASQTIEKASDAAEEAVLGESRFETVKERYKEPVGKGNFHKPRDE